jgi:hypothetical protein
LRQSTILAMAMGPLDNESLQVGGNEAHVD